MNDAYKGKLDDPRGRVELRRSNQVIIIVISAALAVWFLGPRLLGFRSWEWHQRLVLEVNTPTGLVSGGSTISEAISIAPKWVPITAGNLHSTIRGESSFVEVSPGRYLFAVLNDRETERAMVSFHFKASETSSQIFGALSTEHGTGFVPYSLYPELVTFDDLSDPKSVREVDPHNLEATFGPGVSLERIALEVTRERVTAGPIEKILKWLPDYCGIRFDRAQFETLSASNRLANSLSSGAFKIPCR